MIEEAEKTMKYSVNNVDLLNLVSWVRGQTTVTKVVFAFCERSSNPTVYQITDYGLKQFLHIVP